MGIKVILKKLLFIRYSHIGDILYRRPFFDFEYGKRMRSKDEVLHLDLVITECCSLKCRDCSNLMQYYKHPEQINSDEVINDLRKLLACVRVGELKILGGEPFVNQKVLTNVLRFLHGDLEDRVGIINIITNGTIVPGADCINAMKENAKTLVTLSNYGKLSSRQDELIAVCNENNIKYIILDEDYYWLDFGRPVEYQESEEFIKRQYKYCYNRKNCNTLYRGGLYICPRQTHGMRLRMIPDDKDGYVDLYDQKYGSNDELRQAIMELVKRRHYISACRYCISGKYIHVPRGVQNDPHQ